MNHSDLNKLLEEIGITADRRNSCPMPAYEEACNLVDAGEDMFERPQQMTIETQRAWNAMKQTALRDGVELKLVSAYRSVEYQCGLIQKKLGDGRNLDDILAVNAIPGHSEHHTGCALDLHTGKEEPLTDAFEQTEAFRWLLAHAGEFNFHLSYPRDNPDGIAYEPWHWCCHG